MSQKAEASKYAARAITVNLAQSICNLLGVDMSKHRIGEITLTLHAGELPRLTITEMITSEEQQQLQPILQSYTWEAVGIKEAKGEPHAS